MANTYENQFEAAMDLFDNDEREKCIAEAKKNLSDETLPPYYVIKNCLLIACAIDTWEEADDWKTVAERAYHAAFEKAIRKGDKDSLEVLNELREELDELDELKREELTGITREQLQAELFIDDADQEMMDREGEEEMAAWAAFENGEYSDADPEDPDELADAENEDADPEDPDELAKAENENEDGGFEDAEEVARAENADEIAAARILPDRSLHRVVPTLVVEPPEASNNTQITTAPKKFKLGRNKSTSRKGGAYHAHSFNREQAKQASRPSVLDMDWTAEKDTKKE